MHIRVLTRKVHRWGSIVVAIPLLVVIVSGILLQVKKESTWIQPPTVKGSGKTPQISFEAILTSTIAVPDAEVQSWGDIERLDIQPSKGIVKVQCKNRWEVQIDLKSGELLQTAYRRSDLIESLHDGSWFHDSAKLWVFLPAAAILLVLWLTGIYLFFLPILARWSKRRRAAAAG